MMTISKQMSTTELGKLYEKTDVATWPESDSVTPGTFWRTFLCCSYFTGLRLGEPNGRFTVSMPTSCVKRWVST